MTFFGMALLTAIGTVVLALFAVVTAWYARRAFREQSREVAAIEQQVKDEQEVTRQQAELLKVQTGQLEVLRAQLDDQRKASVAQAGVLELQAEELRQLSAVREREAQDRRRAQAVQVYVWETIEDSSADGVQVTAHVRNTSQQPVHKVTLNVPPGRTTIRIEPLLPGQEHSASYTYDSTPPASLGSSAVFRDRAGVRWQAWSNGRLKEIPKPAERTGTRGHIPR